MSAPHRSLAHSQVNSMSPAYTIPSRLRFSHFFGTDKEPGIIPGTVSWIQEQLIFNPGYESRL